MEIKSRVNDAPPPTHPTWWQPPQPELPAGSVEDFQQLAGFLGPELERVILEYVRSAVPDPRHVPTGVQLAARVHTMVNTALSLAVDRIQEQQHSNSNSPQEAPPPPSTGTAAPQQPKPSAADARARAVLLRLLHHMANIGLLSTAIPPLTDAVAVGDPAALHKLAIITQHTVQAAAHKRNALAKAAATVTACVADSMVFLMEDPEASIQVMHKAYPNSGLTIPVTATTTTANTTHHPAAPTGPCPPPRAIPTHPTSTAINPQPQPPQEQQQPQQQQQPLHRLSVSSVSPTADEPEGPAVHKGAPMVPEWGHPLMVHKGAPMVPEGGHPLMVHNGDLNVHQEINAALGDNPMGVDVSMGSARGVKRPRLCEEDTPQCEQPMMHMFAAGGIPTMGAACAALSGLAGASGAGVQHGGAGDADGDHAATVSNNNNDNKEEDVAARLADQAIAAAVAIMSSGHHA